MCRNRKLPSLLAIVVLAGCASVPVAPNVMALPGSGKNFDQFRGDDMICRDFAFQQIGGEAREQAANNAVVRNAVIGTMIGAVAGAAIGGRHGADVGAGTGLIFGSTLAAGNAQAATRGSQRQYDMAYVQCMYAQGHRVPVGPAYVAHPAAAAPTTSSLPPPPPPPVGLPPPPPPR